MMPEISRGRKERLALNLFDYEKITPTFREKLGLARRLDITNKFRFDDTDGIGIPLTGGLLTAALVLDVIRGLDRQAGTGVTRAYLKRLSAWERLPADTVLTTVVNGATILSPAVFPPVVVATPTRFIAVRGTAAGKTEVR